MLTTNEGPIWSIQGGRVVFLPLSVHPPNPAQPRTVFDAQGLQELAASIRQYGGFAALDCPEKGGLLELVAGVRRIARGGACGALRGAVPACERRRSGSGSSGAR